MNNRNWVLSSLAVIVICGVMIWLLLGLDANATAPASAQTGPSTTILTYAIDDAPTAITVVAEALGIQRIAEVRPHLYTRVNTDRTIRTFDRERAEQNLAAIAAICDGATWIVTDIEKKHRDAIRHPDNFSDAEVEEAEQQYIACWSWFRSHWPNALIFEWNLVNAREPGRYTDGESLVLKHLDGFAIGVFYRDKANWREVREQVVAHANSLVAGTDKIVIAGIHEKHNKHQPDGSSKQIAIPREIVAPMVEIALEADVVMLWSNTFRKTIDEPMSIVIARVVEMLAAMRLQNEEQTP